MTIGQQIDNDENDTGRATTSKASTGTSNSQVVMNSNNDNEDEHLTNNSKLIYNNDTKDDDNRNCRNYSDNKHSDLHYNGNGSHKGSESFQNNDDNTFYRIRKVIEWIRTFVLNRLLIGSESSISHNNDCNNNTNNHHQYITNKIQNMRNYIVSLISESSKSTSNIIVITTVTAILLVYIRKRMIVQQQQQQRSMKQRTLLSSIASSTSLSSIYIHQLYTLLQQQLLSLLFQKQSVSNTNNNNSNSSKLLASFPINLHSPSMETMATKTKTTTASSIKQQSKSVVSKNNNKSNSISAIGSTVSSSEMIPATNTSSSSSSSPPSLNASTSTDLNKRPILIKLPSNYKSHKKLEPDTSSNTLASSIASILISCIPFIYLSFLYRILQSTVNKDQNDSMVFGLSKIWSKRKHTNDDENNNNNNKIQNGPTFNDIAGLDDAILEINEIVQYLQNPNQYKQYGIIIPNGVLLYGPAGTGKTLLARAVATEANVNCFIHCSASEFIEIYVGRGAARIRSIFTTAKQQALTNYNNKLREQQHNTIFTSLIQSTYLQNIIPSWLVERYIRLDTDSNKNRNDINNNNNNTDEIKSSCCSAIIFIDELDALGKCRSTSFGSGGGGAGGSSSGANDEREQTLNQLLTEMDGFATKQSTTTSTISATITNKDRHDDSNTNRKRKQQQLTEDDVTVVVIAASNRADVLDPAIVRRFPRQIHIGYPNSSGREAILRTHARHIPVMENAFDNKTNDTKIQWNILASDDMTHNFTGSDLRNVINEAAMYALREKSQYVQHYHLEQAIYKIQQMKQGILHCHLTTKFNTTLNVHDNPIPNLYR